MFKLEQINLGINLTLIITTIIVCITIICSDKLNYAFDNFIGAIKPTCTYQQYVQDKMSCVYDSLKEDN